MGVVSTDRTLLKDWVAENYDQAGPFGVMSRDATQPIYVDVQFRDHSETAELWHAGDAARWELGTVRSIRVRAASYPTRVLLLYTNAPIILSGAPFLAGGNPTGPGAGPVPVNVVGSLGGDFWHVALIQPALKSANPGAGDIMRLAMYWKVVTSQTRPIVVATSKPVGATPGLGANVFSETYSIIAEFAASGGVPALVSAGGSSFPNNGVNGSATGPLPAVSGPTAGSLSLALMMDDPNYNPNPPSGYTRIVYVPKNGLQRVSMELDYLAGNATSGLSWSGNGTGSETEWQTIQAEFKNAGALVQTANVAGVANGDVKFNVNWGTAPTVGNLLVACIGMAHGNSGSDNDIPYDVDIGGLL